MTITDETASHIHDAVKAAMAKALPDTYTPEFAARFAETMVAELRKPSAPDRPVTAAERGTEWMTKYGCLPVCILDHAGADGEPGWHTTAPIETEMRDIDDNEPASENAKRPFLAAQIVVSDYRSQAYGRDTTLWINYGLTIGTVTPAKARETLTAMRGFCADLEAVVDQADEIAEGDFEGDPEIEQTDREAETQRVKRITEAAA